MMVRAAVAVIAMCAIAACSDRRETAVSEQAANTGTAAAAGTPTLAQSKAAATVQPAPGPRRAVLGSDGIAIGKGPATTRQFPFGTARATVDDAAARWLGPGETSANAECGAGQMEFSRYGNITLNYLDGKLVGWMAREDPQAVTSDGIKPGVRLRDLRVTRSVTMLSDSTLEGEFEYIAADGAPIGGFVSGKGSDARVQSLHAGVNCFFR